MLQDKDIKKIQELQADFTPSRVSADDIFSRFKALKLSECFSEFNFFKHRGYDFRMILATLVSMVVSPEKTVNSFLTAPPVKAPSWACMFLMALYRGLHVDHVPVDSWFTGDALIQAIRSVKNKEIHLIGMYKFAKTKFEYQGKSLTHVQINNILGKPRLCRSLGYQYKQAKVMYQGVEIYLFFSRRGKRDKWKVLLTLRFLYDNYESKGALYWSMNADVLRETLDRRLWGLFIEPFCTVCDVLELDAQDLFEKMLANPKAEAMIMALYSSVMGKGD